MRRRRTDVPGVLLLALALFLNPAPSNGVPQEPPEPGPEEPAPRQSVRFEARDVVIDTGEETLAAYQFELLDPSGRSTVAGVEGGEPAAFRDPPYYDPEALSKGRLIIADFSTKKDLPAGRTRVARLHLRIQGDGEPELRVRLVVSATADGREIPATARLEKVRREKVLER